MQCAKTNVMCYGGHLIFNQQRVFVLHPITKVVIELTDSNRIKHLAPKGKILLLAVEKDKFTQEPKEEDFLTSENDKFVRRLTSSKKISGSKHLDRPENQEEETERKRVASKLLSRVLHDQRNVKNREQILNKNIEKLTEFFQARGFLSGEEIIKEVIGKGNVRDVNGLINYLRTVPTMAEELGLTKGSYQSNNFNLSPLLIKLNPITGAKPAKPIYLSPSNIESHAVIRFFERVVPRLNSQHIELAREVIKERDKTKKNLLKNVLSSSLAHEGVTLKASNDAKTWLSNLITDKVGSYLSDPTRVTFADRSSEKNSTGRFILKLDPMLTGLPTSLEVVCDVLREKPGSDSIEIKVISLWRENIHHKSAGYDDQEPSRKIVESSIWDFAHPDANVVKDFARLTEKVIFDSLS